MIKVPAYLFDGIDEELNVCVFCDSSTTLPFCPFCEEYKGMMTIAEWEDYTGEVWED